MLGDYLRQYWYWYVNWLGGGCVCVLYVCYLYAIICCDVRHSLKFLGSVCRVPQGKRVELAELFISLLI